MAFCPSVQKQLKLTMPLKSLSWGRHCPKQFSKLLLLVKVCWNVKVAYLLKTMSLRSLVFFFYYKMLLVLFFRFLTYRLYVLYIYHVIIYLINRFFVFSFSFIRWQMVYYVWRHLLWSKRWPISLNSGFKREGPGESGVRVTFWICGVGTNRQICFPFALQALVIFLEDGGFLVLLHSSNFLSYEGKDSLKSMLWIYFIIYFFIKLLNIFCWCRYR